MLVQIGMQCDPQWLCDAIGWGLGVVLLGIVLLLMRVISRERTRNIDEKQRSFPIHFPQNRQRSNKKKRPK
jgi:hypothetical protein